MLHRSMVGVRRVDGAVKSLLHQARNPSRMVEVRVGQDDGVNRVCRHRQVLPVSLPPFLLSLEETAIHQYLQPWRAVVICMWIKCFEPVTTPAAPRNWM